MTPHLVQVGFLVRAGNKRADIWRAVLGAPCGAGMQPARLRCLAGGLRVESANYEQFLLRNKVIGIQNINSTFFSYCAVEFGTNIYSAVKIVWLVINFFPQPPF
jgi:hypothetical protein